MGDWRSYPDPVFDEVARREESAIRATEKTKQKQTELNSAAVKKMAINKILQRQRKRALSLARVMGRK